MIFLPFESCHFGFGWLWHVRCCSSEHSSARLLLLLLPRRTQELADRDRDGQTPKQPEAARTRHAPLRRRRRTSVGRRRRYPSKGVASSYLRSTSMTRQVSLPLWTQYLAHALPRFLLATGHYPAGRGRENFTFSLGKFCAKSARHLIENVPFQPTNQPTDRR